MLFLNLSGICLIFVFVFSVSQGSEDDHDHDHDHAHEEEFLHGVAPFNQTLKLLGISDHGFHLSSLNKLTDRLYARIHCRSATNTTAGSACTKHLVSYIIMMFFFIPVALKIKPR